MEKPGRNHAEQMGDELVILVCVLCRSRRQSTEIARKHSLDDPRYLDRLGRYTQVAHHSATAARIYLTLPRIRHESAFSFRRTHTKRTSFS